MAVPVKLVTFPVTLTLSFWGPWISASRMPLKFNEEAVVKPIELPGAIVPPDAIVVAGRLPVPLIVAPELTNNPDDCAIEPLTKSDVPLDTVVVPV